MLSLHDASIQHPNRVALVVGEAELTYRQLWEQVAPIVEPLRRSGLSRVGLVAGRDLSTLRLLYALLETGICAVLLHPKWGRTERDAATRMAELDYIVDTGATDPMGGPWPTTDEKWQAPSPEDIAAVVFTSGSTGMPRGVRLSRRALMAAAHASQANLSWRDDDRWLLSMPLAHIGGLSIVTRCLAGQRTVVLQPESRFEPGELIELVEATSTTLWSLVPTMLTRLLRARPELTPPQSLRAVLVGGATAPTALIREARERRWPILTTYGLTEASAQVATQPADQREAPPGAVGLPLPGVEVRVIDGEVQVRGATLFSGYLTDTRSPDTKQPLLEQPTRSTLRWFGTDDAGSLGPDGWLTVVGRRGHVIRTGGEQVHPAEVEDLLLASGEITHACVFGVDDNEWGQRVCAAIVTRHGTAPDESKLNAFLAEHLANWKRPTQWFLLEALPLLPNGKVDRKSARAAAVGASDAI